MRKQLQILNLDADPTSAASSADSPSPPNATDPEPSSVSDGGGDGAVGALLKAVHRNVQGTHQRAKVRTG